MEDLDNVFDVDIVEESRDVKKDHRHDKLTLDSRLSLIHKAEGSVHRTVVVARPKLRRGEDVISVGIG